MNSLDTHSKSPESTSHESESHESTGGGSGRLGRIARWGLPFVVSGAFFWYILQGMEIGAVAERVTPRVALYFGPPLFVFLAVTLLIEALCLLLVVRDPEGTLDVMTTARIKAASYLLGLLNYALGAGALSLLLSRRTGTTLADAAGSVFVISLFDLGSLLVLVLGGAAMLGADAPGVQAGVVVLAGALIIAGFAFLRAPFSMGPLDRLRHLTIFHAARTLPLGLLTKLGLLRFTFVTSFLLLSKATLVAFEIPVPPVQFVINTCILLLIAALPIAAAGLGTGQLAFVALFERWSDPETLLAASLTLSLAMIVTRAGMGLLFAREFTREALTASREADR
jgi:hypothetical protein